VETDWNGLVREHGRAVFGAAWRILGHAADAEDVVQEVFLEAQQLGNSRPVETWQPLLRQIATFRALDKLRRRKESVPLDSVAIAARDHTPEAVAVGNELETRLRQALARLPDREAQVFCLRYFEDASYEQIARSLQISPGAAATALHKAREKLKSLLADTDRDN
jgi:RNA polymerase sigma-70 factor (ECF subfamily)